MPKATAPLVGLESEWALCKAGDDQKHSLIENLFAHIRDVSGKLLEAELELQDKRDIIKLHRDRIGESEKTIQHLQFERAGHAFVLVLIDGDCLPFQDQLVRGGLDGGNRAARQLKQAIEGHVKSSMPQAAHHLQVIVRVYANFKGLDKTYRETGILSEPMSVDSFIRGFNMGDAMCDYTDAGNGKECADEKLKAMFKVYLSNVHCQQIFFGGTADGGYARLLGPYLENEAVRERITLLGGPPAAYELADVEARLGTVSFDHIFRGHTLPNVKRKVSSSHAPAVLPPAAYASAAARAPTESVAASTLSNTTGLTRGPQEEVVLLNSLGQRVDPRLSYTGHEFASIMSRKLCNQFHLLGKCHFANTYKKCSHDHEERLSPREKTTLRAVARLSPCYSGLLCSDPYCIAGHRCTRDGCAGGPNSGCRFGPAMHNVDETVV